MFQIFSLSHYISHHKRIIPMKVERRLSYVDELLSGLIQKAVSVKRVDIIEKQCFLFLRRVQKYKLAYILTFLVASLIIGIDSYAQEKTSINTSANQALLSIHESQEVFDETRITPLIEEIQCSSQAQVDFQSSSFASIEDVSSNSQNLTAHKSNTCISVATVIATKELDGSESRFQGSGFFINERGWFVTTWHLLDGAEHIEIGIANNRYEVKNILAEDQDHNLVIVQLKDFPESIDLLPVNVGYPKGGDQIHVIGNPIESPYIVSSGFVTAIPMIDNYGTVIQFNAPINRALGGSPLVNAEGEVIGVAIWQVRDSESCCYWATPVEWVNSLISSVSFEDGHSPQNDLE